MHFAVLIVTNTHSKLFFSSLSTWYLALSWKTPKWDFLFAHFILCSRFFLNRLYSQLYSFFSIPITSHVCLLKSLQWFPVFELPVASLRSACMPFTDSQLLIHCVATAAALSSSPGKQRKVRRNTAGKEEFWGEQMF